MEHQAAGSVQTFADEEAEAPENPDQDVAAEEEDPVRDSDDDVYHDSDLESDAEEAPTPIEREAYTAPDAVSAAVGPPQVPSAAGSPAVTEAGPGPQPIRMARRAAGGSATAALCSSVTFWHVV